MDVKRLHGAFVRPDSDKSLRDKDVKGRVSRLRGAHFVPTGSDKSRRDKDEKRKDVGLPQFVRPNNDESPRKKASRIYT